MKLNYRAYGDNGSTLIVLHGLFGSSDNWHSISTRLGASHQVFALDLRNHGRSPHSDEISYEVMAEDLIEFTTDQKLASVSLLGHSLGGKVVMQFALTWPEQVDKLIIADMAPRAYPPHHDYIFKALLSLDLTSCKTRQEIDRALEPEIPEPAVRQLLLKSVQRDSMGSFHWRLNLPVLCRHYAELSAALPMDKSCDRPAFFLRGQNSDYIRPEDEPAIRQVFPRALIHTLAGAGHWLHADVPENFLRNVQDFLRS